MCWCWMLEVLRYVLVIVIRLSIYRAKHYQEAPIGQLLLCGHCGVSDASPVEIKQVRCCK